jgi:hypothetical protein
VYHKTIEVGRWKWHTPRGEAITSATYYDSEVFTPEIKPNQIPFAGYFFAWCGQGEVFWEAGSGTLEGVFFSV